MPSSIFGGRGEPVAVGHPKHHTTVRAPVCSEKAKANRKKQKAPPAVEIQSKYQ
jgi:hypothetical protein